MNLFRRHIVWFTAAVLLPCLTLTLLTLLLLDQERQLTTRRLHEAEERRIERARRVLLEAVEPYRLGQAPESRVSFQGVIRNGRVVLSWEEASSAPQARLKAIVEMNRLEQAVASQHAGAFRRIASLPLALTDEYAVPLAFYAIPHLPAEAARLAVLRPLVEKTLANPHTVSPSALHMLQALTVENGLHELARAVQAVCENAEAAAHFQAAYQQIGGAAAGRWVSWGMPMFLIGYAPAAQTGDLAFRAIRASNISSLATLSNNQGVLLGEPFSSVRIQLPPAAGQPPGLSRTLLLSMLGLTLVLALSGGILLWRDVRREVSLARLRTHFIGSVSHEFRTPLTAVRMFIESLKMNPDLDAPTRLEYLDTMLRETERLSRIVNNVLEFSRIEHNRKTYALRPVALPRLLNSIVTSFRPLLDQAGFKLETTIDEAVGDVRADPDALEQAVQNLLTNAMKYSGSSREIQLALLARGERAEIHVRDRGIGLAPSEQRRIFDSFYRVPSPENRTIQGAGLGLTLVRHVAEGHGGEVVVESAPGVGSTFRLVLPLSMT